MSINSWNIKLDEQEAKAAYDSIINRNLSEGKVTLEFERKLAAFLGRKHVICTPSGTTALLLAMMGIGIKPGDEVIVPDFTFIATAHAPKLLGAKIILADTREDLPIMDVDQALNLITPKTKAIIPVHLNGRRADTKKLTEKLKGTGIHIIADGCQAFASGSPGDYAGNDAEIACYSLSVMKLITTGQGGFLATDSDELYEKMKRLKTHGMGIDNIFESNAYPMAGFNMKYPDILASIGLAQLSRISKKVENVRINYKLYADGLQNDSRYKMLSTKEDDVIIYPDILCEDAKKIRAQLAKYEIQSRPAAACLHYADYFEKRATYENAEYFSNHLLYLPGGPDQSVENIERVVEVLRR